MKWKINSLQLSILMSYGIIESLIGIGSYIVFNEAGINGYLCPFISGLMGLLYLFILHYIAKYNENMPIYLVTKEIFGKLVGSILNIILIAIVTIIAIVNLYNISNFVSSQFLIETPAFLVSLLIVILVYINTTSGFQVISRVAFIIIFINIFLFLVACIGITPEVEIDNFKPFLSVGARDVLRGSVMLFSTNILPGFLVLSISLNNIIDKEKIKKHILIAYAFNIFILFLVFWFTIGALGEYLIHAYHYPEYVVLQKISFMNFIDRVEKLVAMQWIFGAIVFISFIVYFIASSLKHNTNDKPNKIITFFLLSIILILENTIFSNNTQFNNFLSTIYPYICLIILPILLIIFTGIFIRRKFRTSN